MKQCVLCLFYFRIFLKQRDNSTVLFFSGDLGFLQVVLLVELHTSFTSHHLNSVLRSVHTVPHRDPAHSCFLRLVCGLRLGLVWSASSAVQILFSLWGRREEQGLVGGGWQPVPGLLLLESSHYPPLHHTHVLPPRRHQEAVIIQEVHVGHVTAVAPISMAGSLGERRGRGVGAKQSPSVF